MQVVIDGTELRCDSASFRSLNEVMDVAQLVIDPDRMIGAVQVDGRHLEEADWRQSFALIRNACLQIQTVPRVSYVEERLADAPKILNLVLENLKVTADFFSRQELAEGHKRYASLMQDIQEFISWYGNVLALVPNRGEKLVQGLTVHIQNIKLVCDELLVQQLSRKWYEVSSILDGKLYSQVLELQKFADDAARR